MVSVANMHALEGTLRSMADLVSGPDHGLGVNPFNFIL